MTKIPYSYIKRLEGMSKEELVKEVNYLAKRIEEEEAARKEEERKTAELEKLVELLESIEKSISRGESRMGEAMPYFQELLKIKDEEIAKMQKRN
ncbi:hypothetical protein [Marseilla massiliensis]|uniref:Uncharacterized protein n=1 Tax=Marseilla massiliensis TaxID=1841864 RepID=A0A938WUA8_9BACT|nr:hypothetical protein [Marseilla massiliensis]MBM6673380.1 hypothetical protein [Marseilla massiliensis]